jgi:hypothetical protein
MESTRHQTLPMGSTPQASLTGGIRVAGRRALAFWRDNRTGLLLWLVFLLFLGLIQFSTPSLPDNDGYYHIKLAYLMRTEGLKPDFVWLPLSILNPREFYDHHFGFHVALMPFTFGDLRLGAKWAAVVFGSLALLSVWSLLKNQRVPLAWLWALGLMAVSEAFVFRMSITRAQSLSLAVLMLAMDWLLRKRLARLALLAAAFVWLYDAFPLLPVIAAIYVLAAWMIERRLDLRPVLLVGLGTAAGLLFNPYFPHNIVFAAQHILPKLGDATSVSVGNEWYPYTTAQLLDNSLLAVGAFVSGGLALGLSGRRMDLRTAFSFLLAGLFGLMLMQSRRFVEYFPPFALVFAAFAWSPFFTRFSGNRRMGIQQEAQAPSDRAGASHLLPSLRTRAKEWLPAAILVAALLSGLGPTFSKAEGSLQASKPYETYAAASAWLAANTPANSRVFQTDWDDFPRLFYYNTHNTYLIGLDPTYMQIYNPALYALWVDITHGKVERPSAAIDEKFGARYVLTDMRHGAFLKRAAQDPGMAEVYRDGEAVIFAIRSTDRAQRSPSGGFSRLRAMNSGGWY